jgi:formylglycine-generating enzyme required for sulfatase activity
MIAAMMRAMSGEPLDAQATRTRLGEPDIKILPLKKQMTASSNTNVHAGPGSSHKRLNALSRGDEVDVTGRSQDGKWYRIALAGGRLGFVLKNMLEEKRGADSFRDCPGCPEMVVVPAGEFMMGSPKGETGRRDNEGPVHRVSVRQPFAIGKYEVTFREWNACVAAGGCGNYRPDDRGWGRGNRPVIEVSHKNAKDYVAWLSRKTGKTYRLPSEAEWEYAARAGTKTPYYSGHSISQAVAHFHAPRDGTVPVGRYPPNAFGLHDMQGNVYEWVEDCWNGDYEGAPSDASVWLAGNCHRHPLRGGAYSNQAVHMRSSFRNRGTDNSTYRNSGFRVAMTLP